MFERIVVGVSKVESAQKAVGYAIDLAKQLDAQLHLVMAFGSDTDSTGRERRRAEGFLESTALAASVSDVQTHALPGDPAPALLLVAKEVEADLIVVGNKGMKGAGRILGSVPNDIAHKADCSVLIVSTT